MRRSALVRVAQNKDRAHAVVLFLRSTRMERDLWKQIVPALRRLPRRRPRNAVFHSQQILAVFLWAALHDRPVSWACRRSSWSPAAWRRKLPDQSTMSRRLRDPSVEEDLSQLLHHLQRALAPSSTLAVDGKALTVPNRTMDTEARNGWASGGYSRGYKLHAIIDASHRLLAFDVHPMNTGESVVARQMVERLEASPGTVLLGDSAYDSNPLHAACFTRGCRLLAPRRKPGTSVSQGHRQHPMRLESIRMLESDNPPPITRERQTIERYFSRLTVAGGLFALPPWVRRLRRVRTWVAAKLAINAARIELTRRIHA